MQHVYFNVIQRDTMFEIRLHSVINLQQARSRLTFLVYCDTRSTNPSSKTGSIRPTRCYGGSSRGLRHQENAFEIMAVVATDLGTRLTHEGRKLSEGCGVSTARRRRRSSYIQSGQSSLAFCSQIDKLTTPTA